MDDDNPLGTETLPGGRALFPVHSGWALDQVVQIDDAAPGFLARVCRARLQWRQALWACLAAAGATSGEVVFRLTGDDGWLTASRRPVIAEFAAVAPKASARDLIEASYRSCPDGLLGALRKLHGQPFGLPDFYGLLHRLFASDDPLDRRRRAALEQCGTLDECRLEAVLAMSDPGLLVPGVVNGLDGEEAVRRFERDVAIIRRLCSWATDDAIKEAVTQARERRSRPFLAAMLSRADRLFPETHPCDADPDLERFPIAKAREVGQSFRNCLSPERILPQAASGVWAMILWRGAELLIETRLLDSGAWAVHRVHAAGNQRVERQTLLRVRDRLAPLGVVCPVCVEPGDELAGVADAFGGWDGIALVAFDAWD
ncbi:MAG TPA: hypothetical protein PLO65_00110 [Caulobacter sp.]|nr:hypothetical protein [Caulobacter sp.]